MGFLTQSLFLFLFSDLGLTTFNVLQWRPNDFAYIIYLCVRLRCPFWNWIKMSTVENHPRCGLLMSDWHNITFCFKLKCPITEHLEMKWITRNKNLEEEFFVKNTIFTLPASNYKLMEISPRKKIYGQSFPLYKKIWKMNSTFTGAICIYIWIMYIYI